MISYHDYKFLFVLFTFLLCNSLLLGQEYFNSPEFKKMDEEKKNINQRDSIEVAVFINKWETRAINSGDSMAMAFVWMIAGQIYAVNNYFVEGREYSIKAEGIIRRNSLEDRFLYNKQYHAYNEIALGNYERGIELALKSIDEFNQQDPYVNRLTYQIIAQAYNSIHNYERMDEYLQKWYGLVKEKNIRMDYGYAIYLIHEFYDNAQMYEKASLYQDKFYKFQVETGENNAQIPEHAFINIDGDTPEESIEKLLKYLPYHIKNDRFNFIAQTYRKLGKLYLELSNSSMAETYFKKAVGITSSISLPAQLNALSGLAESQRLNGNYKSALFYTNQYVTLQDSFKNNQVLAQANELEAKYENVKNELQLELKEAQLRSKNKWLMITTIGGLALLGLSCYTLFLFKKLRHNHTMLTKTVGEKETLLKEIHHRVKNNLQVISSLLSLQSRYVADESAANALNEGQTRVESMALIHQNLYREDNITGVNMKKYIPLLANNIFNSYNIMGDQVNIEYEIDDLQLDVATVIPIGLVLNELISNALKYAFPDNRRGLLRVSLLDKKDRLFLSLSDNGIGIKNEAEKVGFGTKLIQSFARKLDGELKINSENGTRVEILIKNYKVA